MKTLRVGIASYEEMKARTIAIARGRHKVTPDEPRVWFTSAESFARILSPKNRLLLQVISETAPESLAELAKTTGRQKSNLHVRSRRWSVTAWWNSSGVLGVR